MSCHCIEATGRLNLLFKSLDCKTLLIQDISDWLEDEKYTKPLSYTIDLYLPNTVVGVLVEIKLGISNIIKMEDLGYGDSRFMDGIYCIKARVCDRDFKLHRVLLCKARCCYDTYIASKKIEELKQNVLKINFVDRLITDIPDIVESGEIEKAQEYIEMLHRELKYLNCNC